ncbi:type IV toxin-antitoxin system AbiEi family antitoxin domain-containing protein [Kribbella sp. NPDC026611]|uniref:type IV toxin-antitoxin system AbiEi family antitoxin domain-containing protein n=1 Tax=Kribbella sp. NPDC026611 TaxID=3154911 RepID=UPI0033DEDB6E
MNPQLAVMASIRGGVFRRTDARACGYADADIDALLESGCWRRIRHGMYAAQRSLMLVTDEVLHLRRVYRVLRASGPDVFASHQSAAALHALPVWGLDLARVHVTAPDGRSGRLRGGVHRHIRDPVGPGLQVWNGLRLVSPARAVAEVAATSPVMPALVLADAAMYAGLVSRRTLRHALTLLDHGNKRAHAVFDQLTGATSIAESRLRFILTTEGLPTPSPSPPPDLETPDPDLSAASLWFPDERTIVEYEPRFPFWCDAFEPTERDPLPEPPAPDPDDPQPVAQCWISWTDLNDPATVADRIRTTFAQAARRTGIRQFTAARARN